jgi:phosphogluconate dehydratase
VRDGDVLRVDGEAGVLEALVDASDWARRPPAVPAVDDNAAGCGRELFASHRALAACAEQGAVTWAGAIDGDSLTGH